MRWMLLVACLVGWTTAQSLYGINQLDSYSRIIQSNNLGGLGLLQDAILKGKVHNVESEVGGRRKLSGLPPLPDEKPVQRGTPILDSDALVPPHREGKKRDSPHPSTAAPPSNLWGVNPIPELPPRHESKLGGFYDEDGEFHEFEKKKETKKGRRKMLEEEIPHVITPAIGRIDEAPHTISTSRRVFTAPSIPHPRSPTPASLRQKVRRVRQQQLPVQRAFPRQAGPPPSTPAPFQYRPKPKPFDRAPEDNNLLAEVEEYDDWLDQREAYQTLFPGRRVSNPYENVPPGSILFDNVPPRVEQQQQQQQQQQPAFPPPNGAPPLPPLNGQLQPSFPLGVNGPFPSQLFHSQPQFPTLHNPALFPPHPQLNPTGTHFIAARAIAHPADGGKRPPAPTQVKGSPPQPQRAGPLVVPPNGPPTVPPGTIVSIPPGGQIPPGFFPIAAPPQLGFRPPPTVEHILEARDRLSPKSPFENPLVTFFSKLFGKPSGAQ